MTMTSLIWSPKQFWSAYHSLMPNCECIPHTLTNGIITAESPTAKANLLNFYFCSCFTIPPSRTSIYLPPCALTPTCQLSNAHRQKLRSCCVPSGSRLLQALTEYLHMHMLRNTAFSISSSLTKLFNLSLSTGHFCTDWKISNITPVFKSGAKSSLSNKLQTHFSSIYTFQTAWLHCSQ